MSAPTEDPCVPEKKRFSLSAVDVEGKRHFIISIGTSLIGNYDRKMGSSTRTALGMIGDLSEYEKKGATIKSIEGTTLSGNVLKLIDTLKNRESAEKACSKSLEKLSAELSSLLLEPEPIRRGDAVTFVRSKTLSTEICALVIRDLLNAAVPGLVLHEDIVLENIKDPASSEFAEKGLPELVSALDIQIDQSCKEGEKAVLVPTGGFKALIPYYVVMGILHNVPCRYVYEESSQVMTLLHVPLHVDMAAWSSIESILTTLEGQEETFAKKTKLFRENERTLESLLTKKEGENGELIMEKTKLAERFARKVKEERGQPELFYRTRNSPLLAYLDEDLRGKFLRLASLGHLLWKGDRVPEMVDHALLHHADLFSIAERVLLPMFVLNISFLEPKELFALLCALHLHDCGHVVGAVTLRDGSSYRLLPTEVRDFHHVLSYLRLKEPNKHGGSGSWIYEHLKDENAGLGSPWGSTDEEIWSDYLGAAATLCLFHRKTMKIEEKISYVFVAGACPPKIPCLEDFVAEERDFVAEKRDLAGGDPINLSRLKLLVCLLRIIDSLDEQSSRVGTDQERQFHLNLIQMQSEEEKRRAAGMKPILKKLLETGSHWSDLDNAFNAAINNEADIRSAVKRYRCWQRNAIDLPESTKDLVFEYAHATVASHFKRFQKSFFATKAKIEAIQIEPIYGASQVMLKIVVQGDDPEAKKEIVSTLKEEYEVAEKINGSEETQNIVQKTLEDAGVSLEYQESV